jgi:hypothetical protein
VLYDFRYSASLQSMIFRQYNEVVGAVIVPKNMINTAAYVAVVESTAIESSIFHAAKKPAARRRPKWSGD